jgi:hypothetical protein
MKEGSMRSSLKQAVMLIGIAAPAILLPGTVASEDPDPACRPEAPRLDPHEYLRALSLDIRGVVPTMDELELVDGMDDVPVEWIEEWLAGDEFAARVVRRHRELLWPNIGNVDLLHFRRALGSFMSADGVRVYYRTAVDADIRGADVPCADRPAEYAPDGSLVYIEEGGARREGWVEVEPYWAPGTTVRACAYDAYANRYTAAGADCASSGTAYDLGCGCGPNLRWCHTGAHQDAIQRYLAEDVERRIAANVLDDRPYEELLTGRRAFVNGPLVFFWREQRELFSQVPLVPAALDPDHLPDLEYGDADTWVEIELPEAHAGVLTSPVYLLRFQTNRARASRFHDGFLCQPFQPPPGGLPVGDEASQRQPDVQLRDGCQYCHALLEPAAAHWGRWGQQGGGYLDPVGYPVYRPECADCARGFQACTSDCSLHYVTRALSPEEAPYLGMLRAYRFLRPEHASYVDEGPARLVRTALADDRLPSCTVRRTVQWLMGRDPEEREEAWAQDIVLRFVGTDFSYREVVLAVVTSDAYRRVR